MLRLTPQQIFEIAELSDQTLRHWRRVLPPLAGLNGHTPCFALGDALALLVVRHLVKGMGINVSTLAPASLQLFDLCRSTNWPHLSDQSLVIQVERGAVSVLDPAIELEEPAIVVPMRTFAHQLRAAGVSSSYSDQLPLRLPPSGVSRSARMVGA